jgi:hypothetical protein
MSRLLLWKSRSEIAKNCVEIIALSVAAWWAIHTFRIKDAPLLNPHIDAVDDKVNLSWSDSTIPDFCQAVWTITIKNTGNTAVNLHSVRVVLWKLDPPRLSPGKAAYVQFETPPAHGPYLYENTFSGRDDDPLTGPLDPGDGRAHDFTFLVPREPANDQVVFDIAIQDPRGKELIHIYQPPTKRCGRPLTSGTRTTSS